MKTTKTMPFISLLIISALFLVPIISAFDGGGFGGFGSGFDGSGAGGFGSGFDGSGAGGFGSGFDGGGAGGFGSGFDGGGLGGTGSGFDGGGAGSGSTGGNFGDTPTSPPGSFGDGPGGFDGSFPTEPGPFPPGGTPPGGPDGTPPSEADAVWQDLSDVKILKGSPDGTILQSDVFSKCSDADDEFLAFEITSQSENFDLDFEYFYEVLLDENGEFVIKVFADLIIFNLDPAFVGTETITLECNNIPESFNLNVVSPGCPDCPPGPAPAPEDETDDVGVHISSIRIPNAYDAMAGDLVPVTISFKNDGDEKLEDLKASVKIQDLNIKASVGPLDLSVGKKISKTIYVELPEDVQPGTYYARITIDSGSVHRVKHRDVDVIA